MTNATYEVMLVKRPAGYDVRVYRNEEQVKIAYFGPGGVGHDDAHTCANGCMMGLEATGAQPVFSEGEELS